MIDIRYVRDNPEAVKASQRARGADEALVDDLLAADEARRSTLQVAEETRAQQKALSRTVGKASPEDRPTILAQAQELSAKVKQLEETASQANAEFERIGMSIANIIIDGVPAGGEDDYEVLKHVGEVPSFDFPVKDHLDLAEGIKAIDMARGTKVSG